MISEDGSGTTKDQSVPSSFAPPPEELPKSVLPASANPFGDRPSLLTLKSCSLVNVPVRVSKDQSVPSSFAPPSPAIPKVCLPVPHAPPLQPHH